MEGQPLSTFSLSSLLKWKDPSELRHLEEDGELQIELREIKTKIALALIAVFPTAWALESV